MQIKAGYLGKPRLYYVQMQDDQSDAYLNVEARSLEEAIDWARQFTGMRVCLDACRANPPTYRHV